MKLSLFSFLKVEADVESLASKKMDISKKERNGKTCYQIRQEEKRKMIELKHKQEMQKIFLGVGLFVGVMIFAVAMAILAKNGII